MTISEAPPGPPKFARRTYVVDRAFQLKYTGYLVALTLIVSVPLGFLLYRQHVEALNVAQDAMGLGWQADDAANSARDAVRLARQVIETEGPIIDRPTTDVRVDAIGMRARLVSELRLRDAAQRLRATSSTLLISVTIGLSLLVGLVGLAGVLITHKVAGPIYRMRRLLRQIGDGKLEVTEALRRGDELQDFFADFIATVEKLRGRRDIEVRRLDAVIVKAERDGLATESLQALRELRVDLAASIAPPTG